MKDRENINFACNDELKLTISKNNGEVIIDEECCTCISLMLKCNGELATSFLGAHNKEILKIISKAQKQYLKQISKTLKKIQKDEDTTENIEVLDTEIPADKKWDENMEAKGDCAEKKPQTTKVESKAKTAKTSEKSETKTPAKTASSPTKKTSAGKTTSAKKSTKQSSDKREKPTIKK